MRELFTAMMVLVVASALGCPKAPKPTSTEPTVDNRNTNYRPGDGALINSARAGKRVAAMNDFDQLRILMFAHELENNRMPSKEDMRTSLKTDAPNLLKLIDEGAIVMPTQPEKQGLWAYEVDADKAGGIVVFANSVGRKTADEVKTILGKK